MSRGPNGERRPADVNASALFMIAKIATGEIEDVTTEDGKRPGAVNNPGTENRPKS